MSEPFSVVVMGAGLAAAAAASRTLREQGFEGSITFLGAESHYPNRARCPRRYSMVPWHRIVLRGTENGQEGGHRLAPRAAG